MADDEKELKPKISIIIPVYNVKPYLASALDSVLNQTYNNLEIIVVDDGSFDGSEKICDNYSLKDDRIKLIHTEHCGLSASRNIGLDIMKGNYVAFLDADDILLPEAMEKSLSLMLSNDVDGVSFKCFYCNNPEKILSKKIKKIKTPSGLKQGIYSKKEILRAVAEERVDLFLWNKLSKSEIWDNLRFPNGLVYEDRYLIFKFIDRMKKVYVLDEILVLYRNRQDSITKKVNLYLKDLLQARSVFENYIETHIPEIFEQKHLHNVRKDFLCSCIVHYAKILSSDFPEKSELLVELKNKISYLEDFVKIENCRIGIRFLYFMIFNHPVLCAKFYPSVNYMNRCIKKISRIILKLIK